jgi:hypothetical protein
MAITVKKITLWRGKVENRPGKLAEILGPLAEARTDLQVLMGYREPGENVQAVVELYPVAGKKAAAAAQAQGLHPAALASLLVAGDNRPGLGHAIARALGEAGINMSFVVAQALGRKFSAVFGFDTGADADQAAKLIKKAAKR